MRLGQVAAVVPGMMRVVVNQSHFLKHKQVVKAEKDILHHHNITIINLYIPNSFIVSSVISSPILSNSHVCLSLHLFLTHVHMQLL